MPSNTLELLHCWKNQGYRHSKEAIWKVILSFLMSYYIIDVLDIFYQEKSREDNV
jgi:hypothetical protein